ncbi:corticosteroid 11-beta-dehydrogenase isozyme 2 isoform X2 [Xiphias gladius]|uniref:corticosteroid 11-beta-dehydrogenase isozyme 2 isoform X2 n=1 Tax=Xiphias gladius TaxID=8245 RepID=UPI001A9833C6|nr:corticosteroid 11-beta-dehydrogenase isozyme 2 isoform X2 [Xiphias gladius]
MMDDYTLPFWIYLGVLTVFVGGAMKKILASHLSTASTLVAWLGATVLLERLWVFCLPAMLLLALLGLACCLYSAARTGSPPATLPAQGKAVLITGLWGLVNNAGVCVHFGDAELSLMSNFRGCMEVNFFGTLNITKSFLPLVRQAKGRIVTISSPAGDQPFPCLAAYGASKAALNLFMNTLQHELEPWGVQVSIILPSAYKTGQSSNHAYWEQQHRQLLQSLCPGLLEEYGEDYVTETKELFQSHASKANPNLSPVVDTIIQALLSPQPQARYFAGPGVGFMYFIHTYCPFSISNRFLQKLFVKKKLMPRALRKQSSFDLNLSLHNNNNNNKEKLKEL